MAPSRPFGVYIGRDKRYDSKSFGLVPVSNAARFFAVRVVDNVWFERVVLAVIVANCVVLAVEDTDAMSESTFELLELIFSVVYSLEMAVKIFASGVVMHSTAYFRSGWNILDFLVVVLGWLTLVPGFGNFTAVRAFRVLRTVRTIRHVRGIRVLVETLLAALPALARVIFLISFALVFFAIYGNNLWSGNLRQVCVGGVPDLSVRCSTNADHGMQCGVNPADKTMTTCIKFDSSFNPDHGFTSFDHFGWSLLAGVRVFSGDAWADVLFYIMDSWSNWAVVLFVPFVLFCLLFALNFMLAVIFDNYVDIDVEAAEADRRVSKAIARAARNLAVVPAFRPRPPRSSDSDSDSDSDSCDTATYTYSSSADEQQEASTYYSDTESGYSSLPPVSSASDGDVAFDSKPVVRRYRPARPVGTCPRWWEHPLEAAKFKYGHHLAYLSRSPRALKREYLAGKPAAVRALRTFVDSVAFAVFISLVVAANIVIMAVEHASMSETARDRLDLANAVCIGIFVVEAVLKLIAMGFRGYTRDRFNVFDFLIVVASIIELVAVSTTSVSVFRVLRVARVARISRSFRSFRYVRATIDCLTAVVPRAIFLTILLAIFVFTFAIIGKQLFRNKMLFDETGTTRATFDSFFDAIVTTFVLVSGKGFATIIYDTMRVEEWYGSLFCIVVFVVGRLLLANLYAVVVLASWRPDPAPPAAAAAKTNSYVSDDYVSTDSGSSTDRYTVSYSEEQEEASAKSKSAKSKSAKSKSAKSKSAKSKSAKSAKSAKAVSESSSSDSTLTTLSSLSAFDAGTAVLSSDEYSSSESVTRGRSGVMGALWRAVMVPRTDVFAGVPLHLSHAKPAGTSKSWIGRMVTSQVFEVVVDVVVVASAVVLFFDSASNESTAMLGADIGFAALFALELAVRAYGYGALFWRDGWCWLDCVVAACSVAGCFAPIRFLRALRLARVLRVLMRTWPARVVMHALYVGGLRLSGPFAVFVLVYVSFALVGLQLFQGRFSSCSDASIKARELCVGVANGQARRWVAPSAHFDDFGAALLSMFQLTALTDWLPLLYAGIDAADEINTAPRTAASRGSFVFFAAYIIVQLWIVLPLFLAAIVETFADVARELGGTVYERSAVVTARVAEFVHAMAHPLDDEYASPLAKSGDNASCFVRARQAVFTVVTSNAFELLVASVIAANTAYLALRHEGQSESFGDHLLIMNFVFVVLYAVEAAAKVFALGTQYFYPLSWNTFDFGVLLVSIAGLVVELTLGSSTALSVFRIFRVLRTVRLVAKTGRLQALFYVAYRSLVPLVVALAVVACVAAPFAFVTMEAFGNDALAVGQDNNSEFGTLAQSLLQYLRVFTGETWQFLVVDQLDKDWKAIVLFVAFWLVANMMLVQVFVAIAFAAYGEAARYVKIHALENGLQSLRTAFVDAAAAARDVDIDEYDHNALLARTPITPAAALGVFAAAAPPLTLPKWDADRELFFTVYNVPVGRKGVFYHDVVAAVAAVHTSRTIPLPPGSGSARGSAITLARLVRGGLDLDTDSSSS